MSISPSLTDRPETVTEITPAPHRPRSALMSLVVLLVIGGVFGGGLWWVMNGGPVSLLEGCESTVAGQTHRIDLEQAEVASAIASVAASRQLPARAVSIAYAAGFQESDLHNIDYGDRDSLGVFQQRPSQGWGTPRQVMQVRYASRAFFDALVTVPGYQSMTINDAAQAVQRSAYPDHYAKHEESARALASAMTGYSPAAFTCLVRHAPMAAQQPGEMGLTERARVARDDLVRTLRPLVVTGQARSSASEKGAADTGTAKTEAAENEAAEIEAARKGRAFAVSVVGSGDLQRRHGWEVAHWAVANADRLGVERVSYAGRSWRASRSSHGWEAYGPKRGPAQVRIEVVAGE